MGGERFLSYQHVPSYSLDLHFRQLFPSGLHSEFVLLYSKSLACPSSQPRWWTTEPDMADEMYEVCLKDGSTLQIMHFSKEATPGIRKMKREATEAQDVSIHSSQRRKSKKRKHHRRAEGEEANTQSPADPLSQSKIPSEAAIAPDAHEPWTNSPTAKVGRTAPSSGEYLSSPIKSSLPKSEGGPVSTSSPPPAITIIRPPTPQQDLSVDPSTQNLPLVPEQVFLLSQTPLVQPLHTPLSGMFGGSDRGEQPERELIACYLDKNNANQAAVTACLQYTNDRGIDIRNAIWKDSYDENGCLRLAPGWTFNVGPAVEITVEQVALISKSVHDTEEMDQDHFPPKIKAEEPCRSALDFDLNLSDLADTQSSSSMGPMSIDAHSVSQNRSTSEARVASTVYSRNCQTEIRLPLEGRNESDNLGEADPASSVLVNRKPVRHSASLSSSDSKRNAYVNIDEDDESDGNQSNKHSNPPHIGECRAKAAVVRLPSSSPDIERQTAAEVNVDDPSLVEGADQKARKRRRVDRQSAETVDTPRSSAVKQDDMTEVAQIPGPTSFHTTTPQRKLIFRDVSIPRSHKKYEKLNPSASRTNGTASEPAKWRTDIDLTIGTPPQQTAALPVLARGGLHHISVHPNASPSSGSNTSTTSKKLKALRRKATRKENRVRRGGQGSSKD